MAKKDLTNAILKRFLELMTSNPLIGKDLAKDVHDLIANEKCTKNSVEVALKKRTKK